MRHAINVLFMVSMLALAACGGSSKPAKPIATTAPLSDEAFKAAADQAAHSALIVANDLPAGWTAKRHESDDTKLDLSPACAPFNEVDPWRSSVSKINSDDFTDSADRTVSTQATSYRTAALADGDSSFADTIVTQCGEEISRAMESFIVRDAPGATAHVTFAPLVPAELGGWSAGYKLSINATSATGEKTFATSGAWLWKVSGRMIAALEYSGETPLDPGFVDAVKSIIAKRLADADATLPN
jgi:hypothetical protein